MIELTNFMMQHFLQGINLNILFSLIVTLAFNNIRHFVKVQLVNKGIESTTYPVYVKVNLLPLLCLLFENKPSLIIIYK